MNYGGSSHDPEFLSNGFKVVGTFFLGNVPQYELERLSWLRRNYRKGFDFNQFELINGESYRWTNKKTAINVDEYEQQWKFLKDYIHNSIFAFDAETAVLVPKRLLRPRLVFFPMLQIWLKFSIRWTECKRAGLTYIWNL